MVQGAAIRGFLTIGKEGERRLPPLHQGQGAAALFGVENVTGGGLVMMLKTKNESFDPPSAERVSMLVFAAGAMMLALGLLIEYYRLVH